MMQNATYPLWFLVIHVSLFVKIMWPRTRSYTGYGSLTAYHVLDTTFNSPKIYKHFNYLFIKLIIYMRWFIHLFFLKDVIIICSVEMFIDNKFSITKLTIKHINTVFKISFVGGKLSWLKVMWMAALVKQQSTEAYWGLHLLNFNL